MGTRPPIQSVAYRDRSISMLDNTPAGAGRGRLGTGRRCVVRHFCPQCTPMSDAVLVGVPDFTYHGYWGSGSDNIFGDILSDYLPRVSGVGLFAHGSCAFGAVPNELPGSPTPAR